MAIPTLLVVDGEPAVIDLFRYIFQVPSFRVVTASTVAGALEVAAATTPDVALLDVLLPDGSGLDAFRRLKEMDARLPVVIMSAGGSSDTAILAMKMGALEYLTKPLDVVELQGLVDRALEIRRWMNEPVQVDPDADEPASGDALVGRCAAMQRVYKAIGRVATQNVTVLIRGESGTGKELVARALYHYSDRANAPFLAVNCAAIPQGLLESELFGHEKGAFTGADKKRIGKFEQCNGGTLFLDEIGDMDSLLQSKLLRVLQEQRFERVGGNETIHTNVRVIAATNTDLERMVSRGRFREDLYYRLNGFTITLPPLRERGDDLELLVEHFRRLANRDLQKHVQRVSPEALQRLRQYHWPGNVRELQSVIRRGLLQTTGPVLLAEFLPELRERSEPVSLSAAHALQKNGRDAIDQLIDNSIAKGSSSIYDEVINEVERRLITRLLNLVGGNQTDAARMLGITRTTLRSKIEKLKISIDRVARQTPGDIDE